MEKLKIKDWIIISKFLFLLVVALMAIPFIWTLDQIAIKLITKFHSYKVDNILNSIVNFFDHFFDKFIGHTSYDFEKIHKFLLDNENEIINDCLTLSLSSIARCPYRHEILWEIKNKYNITCQSTKNGYILRAHKDKKLIVFIISSNKSREKRIESLRKKK